VQDVDAREGEEHLAEVARGTLLTRWKSDPRFGKALACELELGIRVARSEEPVVSDLGEAVGQDVQEEAAKEFVVREGRGGLGACAEDDALVVEREDAGVGEADAMGIAADVAKERLGSAEGRLGVDDPARLVDLRRD
jgi:hypothetical protein